MLFFWIRGWGEAGCFIRPPTPHNPFFLQLNIYYYLTHAMHMCYKNSTSLHFFMFVHSLFMWDPPKMKKSVTLSLSSSLSFCVQTPLFGGPIETGKKSDYTQDWATPAFGINIVARDNHSMLILTVCIKKLFHADKDRLARPHVNN